MGVPVQVWHLPPLYVKAQISSDLSAVFVGLYSRQRLFLEAGVHGAQAGLNQVPL